MIKLMVGRTPTGLIQHQVSEHPERADIDRAELVIEFEGEIRVVKSRSNQVTTRAGEAE